MPTTSLKVRKPTRVEVIARTTAQEHSHMDTESIVRQRKLLVFQVGLVDAEMHTLSMRIANGQTLKASLEAQILSLSEVIEKRS